MAIFNKTVFGINVVGPQGVNASNDFVIGETVDGETGVLVGKFVVASSGLKYLKEDGEIQDIPQLPDLLEDTSKIYKLVVRGNLLEWEETTDIEIPALPSDAATRSLVLKSIGGELVWVDAIVVDPVLSGESTNPIENQAVSNAVEVLTQKINALEGQTVRLLYTAKENPSAAEIQQFVLDSGYDVSFWSKIAVVVRGTYHVWHCYANSEMVEEWDNVFVNMIEFPEFELNQQYRFSWRNNYYNTDAESYVDFKLTLVYTDGAEEDVDIVGNSTGELVSTYGKSLVSVVVSTTMDPGVNLLTKFVVQTFKYEWRDDGVDTVANFTNNSPGMIKGSLTDGCVAAQNDGTGRVSGWEDVATKSYAQEQYGTIVNSGEPTTSTAGNIGQFYIDSSSNTKDLYQCIAIAPLGTEPETYSYTWVKVIRSTNVAANSVPGVVDVRAYFGLDMDVGRICTVPATNQELDNKNQHYHVLTPENYTHAVSNTYLKGVTAPNVHTPADFIGQLYLNTFSSYKELFQCVSIGESQTKPGTYSYTWVRLLSGINTTSSIYGVTFYDDRLATVKASDAEIDAKEHNYHVITPSNINYAVKSALSANNHLTLTAAEKATVHEVLGINNVITVDSTNMEEVESGVYIDVPQMTPGTPFTGSVNSVYVFDDPQGGSENEGQLITWKIVSLNLEKIAGETEYLYGDVWIEAPCYQNGKIYPWKLTYTRPNE